MGVFLVGGVFLSQAFPGTCQARAVSERVNPWANWRRHKASLLSAKMFLWKRSLQRSPSAVPLTF